MSKINLGCGKGQLLEGYLNVDKYFVCDKYLDLEKTPWDLPPNNFEEINMTGVLEHLNDTITIMEEIYRISKPNAKVFISVPHYSSVFAHSPLHKKYFNISSMNNFTKNTDEHYGKCEYKIISKKIFWQPHAESYRNSNFVRKTLFFLGEIMNFFINLKPTIFERFWCYYVGGACDIEWELKVVKE